jgi:hypothetical protein
MDVEGHPTHFIFVLVGPMAMKDDFHEVPIKFFKFWQFFFIYIRQAHFNSHGIFICKKKNSFVPRLVVQLLRPWKIECFSAQRLVLDHPQNWSRHSTNSFAIP